MATKIGEKKVRVKKPTAKSALEFFLSKVQPVLVGADGEEVRYVVDVEITEEQYKTFAGLLAAKPKKVKNVAPKE